MCLHALILPVTHLSLFHRCACMCVSLQRPWSATFMFLCFSSSSPAWWHRVRSNFGQHVVYGCWESRWLCCELCFGGFHECFRLYFMWQRTSPLCCCFEKYAHFHMMVENSLNSNRMHIFHISRPNESPWLFPLGKAGMLIYLYVSWSGVMVVSENSNAPFSGLERMSQNVLLVSLKSTPWGLVKSLINLKWCKCIWDALSMLRNPRPTM